MSFLVEADEVRDEQSLRHLIAECWQTSVARKRSLEVKERACNWEERRALACAKRAEFGSWLDNQAIDLATSRGIPRHKAVRCRWVLTFKKLDGSEQKDARATMDPHSSTVKDGSGRKAKRQKTQ